MSTRPNLKGIRLTGSRRSVEPYRRRERLCFTNPYDASCLRYAPLGVRAQIGIGSFRFFFWFPGGGQSGHDFSKTGRLQCGFS
jgi:hypothetical protein